MCNPASFVVTKNCLVFWSKIHDQHHLIIKENNLRDAGVRGINIIKVEITPPTDGRKVSDLKNWDYTLDETEIPSWYNASAVEAACRRELHFWAKYHVIRSSKTFATIDGHRSLVLIRGHLKIGEVISGYVWSYGESHQEIDTVSGGDVRSCDKSHQEIGAVSGGYVRSYGESHQEIGADLRIKQ